MLKWDLQHFYKTRIKISGVWDVTNSQIREILEGLENKYDERVNLLDTNMNQNKEHIKWLLIEFKNQETKRLSTCT